MTRYEQMRATLDALAESMAVHDWPKVYLAADDTGISPSYARRLWRLIQAELGDQAR